MLENSGMNMRPLLLRFLIITSLLFTSIFADEILSEELRKQGLKAYLNGQTEQAETLLNQSLDENPENTKTVNSLKQIYLYLINKNIEDKNFVSASSYVNKLLDLDPKSEKALAFREQLNERRQKSGRLKNYNEDSEQKSQLESDLDAQQEVIRDESKPLSEKYQSLEDQSERYQQIIVETEKSGALDEEGLDEFIAALNNVKEQDTAEQMAYLKALEAKEAQLERERQAREADRKEQKKESLVNQLIIYALIFIIIVIVVAISLTIIWAYNQYKKRQEVKEGKMMDVMMGLSQGIQTASQISQTGPNTGLEHNPQALIGQSHEEFIEIPKAQALKMKPKYTVTQMTKDLESETVRIKIDALVACYYYDKERMSGLASYWLSNHPENPNFVSGILWATTIVEDVDVFRRVFTQRQELNLKHKQVVLNSIRCFGTYLYNTEAFDLSEPEREKVQEFLKTIDQYLKEEKY